MEELPDPKLPGYVLARVVSECDVVCSISGAVVCGDWGRHPLHSGRARLIAAAPELLEVADHIDRTATDIADDMVVISGTSYRLLRAAIAKATGQ